VSALTNTNELKYCPYTSLIEYLNAIEVLTKENTIKIELLDCPLFIKFKQKVYYQDYLPLHPSSISKMVSKLAMSMGYEKGKISGHSMRKGFATQFVSNKMENESNSIENIRKDLCEWVGWDPKSKVIKSYINDSINWQHNMTPEIDNMNADKFNIDNYPDFKPKIEKKSIL